MLFGDNDYLFIVSTISKQSICYLLNILYYTWKNNYMIKLKLQIFRLRLVLFIYQKIARRLK